MSQTSVGSGTPNDRNENPPPSDGYPSKTFGAEASAPPEVAPEPARPSEPATVSEASHSEPAESDATDLPSPMDAPVDTALDAMPDVPNVAPSAWELEAAQGEPDPQDPVPRHASDV